MTGSDCALNNNTRKTTSMFRMRPALNFSTKSSERISENEKQITQPRVADRNTEPKLARMIRNKYQDLKYFPGLKARKNKAPK
ncbi:MAG: hypothetical protein KA165_05010 [Saprospiraceae bacterium]|nr:hypothetical protein [Saprospiraceae bacterium]